MYQTITFSGRVNYKFFYLYKSHSNFGPRILKILPHVTRNVLLLRLSANPIFLFNSSHGGTFRSESCCVGFGFNYPLCFSRIILFTHFLFVVVPLLLVFGSAGFIICFKLFLHNCRKCQTEELHGINPCQTRFRYLYLLARVHFSPAFLSN